MSFSLKVMPAHAIIIATLHRDFSPEHDLSACIRDLRTQLDRMPHPAAFIAMIDEVEHMYRDVDGLLDCLSQLRHPNLRSMIVVTSRDLVPFSAGPSRQGEGRKPPVLVARTLGDAVAQAV